MKRKSIYILPKIHPPFIGKANKYKIIIPYLEKVRKEDEDIPFGKKFPRVFRFRMLRPAQKKNLREAFCLL